MAKSLLVEYLPFSVAPQQIAESARANGGRVIVSGVLQRADARNQNERVYPRTILEREVKKFQEVIQQRRALGELDHPESSVVNLRNVSHNIIETWWEGNDLFGKVEILSTPSGNILKELLQSGITVGISSRGMGSTQPLKEGGAEVSDDFELITWDFVSNPSTHGAFMHPVTEGKRNQPAVTKDKYSRVNSIMHTILNNIGS